MTKAQLRNEQKTQELLFVYLFHSSIFSSAVSSKMLSDKSSSSVSVLVLKACSAWLISFELRAS